MFSIHRKLLLALKKTQIIKSLLLRFPSPGEKIPASYGKISDPPISKDLSANYVYWYPYLSVYLSIYLYMYVYLNIYNYICQRTKNSRFHVTLCFSSIYLYI